MGRLFKRSKPAASDDDAWSSEEEPFDRATTLASAQRQLAGGELDPAEQSYRKILAENSDDVDGLRGLGAVSEKKGFRQNAILIYNKLLAINPQDEEARARLKALMASA